MRRQVLRVPWHVVDDSSVTGAPLPRKALSRHRPLAAPVVFTVRHASGLLFVGKSTIMRRALTMSRWAWLELDKEEVQSRMTNGAVVSRVE